MMKKSLSCGRSDHCTSRCKIQHEAQHKQGNTINFEDPSVRSESTSISDSSGGDQHYHHKFRKRSRHLHRERQQRNFSSQQCSDGDVRLICSRSLSSDYYGDLCCRDRCSLRSQSCIYSLVIILLGGSACVSVLVSGIHSAHQSSQKLFRHKAAGVVRTLQNVWREYETVLLWIHQSCYLLPEAKSYEGASVDDEDSSAAYGTFIAEQVGFCSRPDFAYLVQHIDSLQLPLVSIQFAPIITHAQRPGLEEESELHYSRLTGADASPDTSDYPYIGITNVRLDPQTGEILERTPAPESPMYFPAHYVHPLEDAYNQAMVEMDLYSTPAIKADIQKAYRTFHTVMGGRFRIQMPDDLEKETHNDIITNIQWAISVVHPGNDDYIPDGDVPSVSSSGAAIAVDLHRHHSISRIVVRPTDLIKRSVASLDFPEDGGMSVYIFDKTVAMEPAERKDSSHDCTFLAGVDLIEGGELQNLPETTYEYVEGLITSSLRNSRIFEETVRIADHEWTIVVIPRSTAYKPGFAFVMLGTFLLFVATILVTFLQHRSMAQYREIRILKSQQTRDKAENALLQSQRERHLNDFIAHAVRNPLSSALAALSFVREGVQQISDDASRQSLENDLTTVQNSLDYIDDLLRNMLDIHRTARHDFTIRYSPTNLRNGLLNPCRDIASSRGGGSGVNFVVQCSKEIWAEVDPLRIEQVLLNLAMDASKYVCDGGFVRFRAAVVNRSVRLYIEDSGPGIQPENKGRLFQPYQQSLGVISQGTGGGLCTCKTLIDLMGAKIWLDDSYDSGVPGCPGTRFVIDLQRPSLTKCLLSTTGFCDDNCNCLDSIAKKARTKGNSASSIRDPSHKEREEEIVSCPEVNDSDRITVEAQQFVSTEEWLVDLDSGRRNTTSIPKDSETGVSVIRSNVDNQTLVHSCASVSREFSCQNRNDDKEDYGLPEHLSLLFVDDDKTLRKLFCRSARRLDPTWKVADTHNGETALEMVRKHKYDFIFMDQYMESTSKQLLGSEAVRVMRESGLVDRQTIICGLSANEEKDRFLAAGADNFLLKPIQCTKDALKAQMLRLLQEASGEVSTGIKDDIQLLGSQCEVETADARNVRYQRRRSSC